MVVVINKNTTKEDLSKAISNLRKRPQKGLRKFYGKLQRDIDGLVFQKTIRDEWD